MPEITFDDYVSELHDEAPSVLVHNWWGRLEHEVCAVSQDLGYEDTNSVVERIEGLGMHPAIEPEVVEELHSLRRKRNAVAHDLDAPALTTGEARDYARRALALTWYLSQLR